MRPPIFHPIVFTFLATYSPRERLVRHTRGHVDLGVAGAGEYTCVASTDLDKATSGVARVAVRPVLVVSVPRTRLEAVEGAGLSLECRHEGGAEVAVTWYKDHRERITSGPESLELSSVLTSHSGNYTCNVDDGLQSVNSTDVMVRVYRQTVVSIHPREHHLLVGDNMTLTCEVSREGNYLDPETSLHWLREEEVIRTEKISGIHSLTLAGVSAGDAGRYRCAVQSELERCRHQYFPKI